MASEDRRMCHSIFRIEHGTFQESHSRVLACDYSSLNDDEEVFLRVTKVPSANTSPLSINKKLSTNGKHLLINSSMNNVTYRDSWDDAGQTLNDNNNGQLQSLSDDYVFL
jgi:hypothetical protein